MLAGGSLHVKIRRGGWDVGQTVRVEGKLPKAGSDDVHDIMDDVKPARGHYLPTAAVEAQRAHLEVSADIIIGWPRVANDHQRSGIVGPQLSFKQQFRARRKNRVGD